MIKILKFSEVSPEEIFARREDAPNVEKIVADIIADVRENGDAALFAYCEKFDHAKLDSLLVTQQEIDQAVESVEPRFLEILRQAAENIRRFHSQQVRRSFILNKMTAAKYALVQGF